jgi:hypothetical protein
MNIETLISIGHQKSEQYPELNNYITKIISAGLVDIHDNGLFPEDVYDMFEYNLSMKIFKTYCPECKSTKIVHLINEQYACDSCGVTWELDYENKTIINKTERVI